MTKIREFDPARYLDDETMMAEYLAACLEDLNPDVFLAALGDVAKARGITQLAKDTGLRRESLYKTFAAGKKPQFETVLKTTKALADVVSEFNLTPKRKEVIQVEDSTASWQLRIAERYTQQRRIEQGIKDILARLAGERQSDATSKRIAGKPAETREGVVKRAIHAKAKAAS